MKIQVGFSDEREPAIFAMLERIPKEHRAERIRTLIALGMVLERSMPLGVGTVIPGSPDSPLGKFNPPAPLLADPAVSVELSHGLHEAVGALNLG
ncbi:MAG: hypothetical protein ACREPQ_14130 [Rhodanobacter sp.]